MEAVKAAGMASDNFGIFACDGTESALKYIATNDVMRGTLKFGSVAMAGNTAGQNVEGFVYVAMNSVHQTAVSFTSQNLGGRQYRRINKILIECVLFVTAISVQFCQAFPNEYAVCPAAV